MQITPNIRDLTQEELEEWLQSAYRTGWENSRYRPNHNLSKVAVGWGMNDLSRPTEFPVFVPELSPR